MILFDYTDLLENSVLTSDPDQLKTLVGVCKVINANDIHYRSVAVVTQVPWPVIGAIHFRESSLDFKCHLHNGDPLTARTIHTPINRPMDGEPPFTWAASAIDAFRGRWFPDQWDVAGCLEFIERYNGLGYQKRGVNSPYLWDFTNLYRSGLYTADGVFDPNKKESRPGAVAILKMLGYFESLPKESLH